MTEVAIMAAITISNLPDETLRALEARAALNHRTPEAEMRAILEAALLAEKPVMLGTVLSNISRNVGLANEDVEALEEVLRQNRDPRPIEPMTFD
jgi:antitoxin FitA